MLLALIVCSLVLTSCTTDATAKLAKNRTRILRDKARVLKKMEGGFTPSKTPIPASHKRADVDRLAAPDNKQTLTPAFTQILKPIVTSASSNFKPKIIDYHPHLSEAYLNSPHYFKPKAKPPRKTDKVRVKSLPEIPETVKIKNRDGYKLLKAFLEGGLKIVMRQDGRPTLIQPTSSATATTKEPLYYKDFAPLTDLCNHEPPLTPRCAYGESSSTEGCLHEDLRYPLAAVEEAFQK